jgi:hypothetical protein
MTSSFDIVAAMSKPLETTRGISSQTRICSATQFNMNVNEVITNRVVTPAGTVSMATRCQSAFKNFRRRSPGLGDQYCRTNDKPALGRFSAAVTL